MGRIHGDVIITRRTNLPVENHYSKYREDLTKDFRSICGYCGKHIQVSRRGFEIDHFVPISTDEARKNHYSNLVLSCFTCNRKKSKKWPTKNKDICHDDKQGFVDPTSREYDTHLGRSMNGAIEHYTKVGKYMYGVFKFRLRPTDMVWKSMELIKRKEELYRIRKTSNLEKEELELFIEIQDELDQLLNYLLGKGE
jgi:uncharacterized protein (TIGR02646 family)